MEETTYKILSYKGKFTKVLLAIEIHKKDTSLRPIVSSRGSVTYGVAKELVRILKPLVGRTIHCVNNTKEFADKIKNTKQGEGKCITSYDVSALFTSIPAASAIDIIKNRLEWDTKLPKRTIMFFLHNTYFSFQGQCFEQTKGAAMGSPVSPIAANLHMKAFEHRAITTAVNPPRIWKRYVDDTFVIQQQTHIDEFLKHINSVGPSIQVTVEESRSDGSMPFPDTLVTPQTDGTLPTGVYI